MNPGLLHCRQILYVSSFIYSFIDLTTSFFFFVSLIVNSIFSENQLLIPLIFSLFSCFLFHLFLVLTFIIFFLLNLEVFFLLP